MPTRKARALSKITIDHEDDASETTLSAQLDTTHTAPSFAELGVRDEIVRALAELGIERTFAIQELTLPLALAGDDLIGQARTGMGKTFGFGVPLLHRISSATGSPDDADVDARPGTAPLDGTPRALVIVPTRELCIQVTEDLVNAGKYLPGSNGRKLSVLSIYGGRPYETQIEALQRGVDVIVGTPGRLLDLAKQGHLILGKVGVLVLDEADEMLDLGFLPDIERILQMVPDARQTMLFSATMPGPIITLARTFLTQPTHIRAEEPESSAVHDRTSQHIYRAHALDKAEMVARILQAEGRGATMIFTRTKRTAQKVADELNERGFSVGAVHGDLGQIAREKALKAFRTGKVDVLVATDVAARGIDIDDVTHVVNYQCPEDEKTYVHRIGRTGRAGRTGTAVTLVDWDDVPRWQLIDKALDLGVPDPVETYSSSEHLYAELNIPTDAKGTVRKPRTERAQNVSTEDAPAAGDGTAASEGGAAERPRRTRTRKRTRGGRTAEAASTAPADTSSEAVAPEPTSPSGDAAPARRRRRRRRSSGGAGADATTAAASE
ncbi:DEAD/DEAH box helicase [Rhodococcus triatomae]|nr:dead/deah box helicase [Rhodococcus triatomae BKS 15-14]